MQRVRQPPPPPHRRLAAASHRLTRHAAQLLAVLALLLAPQQATAVATVGDSTSSDSNGSGSGGTMTDEQQRIREAVREWYTSNFRENETQLLGLPTNRTTGLPRAFKPCPQMPSLQMRSSTIPAKGCPKGFDGLSCVCLTNYARDGKNEFWEFKVRKKAAPKALAVPLSAESILEIDSIATIWVPDTLRGLRFNGISSEPLPIPFISDDRGSLIPDMPIAQSESPLKLETIEIFNIDMDAVTVNAINFVPRTVTRLVMQNCNVRSINIRLGDSLMPNMQYIDLSNNKLTFVMIGSNTTGVCAICGVQTLNVENNQITVIPEYLVNLANLESLYMAGNNLSYEITMPTFNVISRLANFSADGPAAPLACKSGKHKTVHNVTFCVIGATSGDDDDNNTGGTNYLVYILVACGVAVAALALFVLRQRCQRSHRSSSKDEGMFMNTLDFDESHSTSQARLLSDPLLITNRIEYKEVVLGNCISKGGFGLVFAGEYRGRKVAVKKIRPDLSTE
ncbi:hypothetical protein PybrP1_010776, partial [[Pythium] brassicae (nom. inval.)]